MKAVIMAGGKGIRLSTVLKDLPKPMVCIDDKPILEHQILNFRRYGINEIIIVIGFKGSVIKEYFGDGQRLGVSIEYFEENEPLGTAGALYYLKKELSEDFILLYGDLMLDINWEMFVHAHKEADALITMFVHPNDHPQDSDVIAIDESGRVTGILYKNGIRNAYYSNIVSAGVYCINKSALEQLEKGCCDLEKDLINSLLATDRVRAYRSTEYVKDIGTPVRLENTMQDYHMGIVGNRNYSNKQKAIFLDRDGTINVLKGYIRSENEFELLPRAAEAIKMINQSGFLAIVVTNQPVIARGEATPDKLELIHNKLQCDLGEAGAYIDDLYYCPHHPDKGFYGENIAYKIDCECRKPKPGMIYKAADRHNIDLSRSWIIGDTLRDVQTGKNSGLKTVLIKNEDDITPNDNNDIPDYYATDLYNAVQMILGAYEMGEL